MSGWTKEQEDLIQKYVERGMSRSNAVRKMKTERGEPKSEGEHYGPNARLAEKAKTLKVKEPKADKPTISRGDAKHYDQQAVIDGFLKHGKTISELAAEQKPMSHVYCHRILTTKVPKEYKAEQARRAAARVKEAK